MKGHKAHHHGKKAGGGRIGMVASGNPDVLKEANNKADYDSGEKKHGGRAKAKRAAGGKVAAPATKTIGLMTGGAVRPRGDRPGRKTGGRVGADRAPLSSAHKGSGDGTASPSPKDTYGGTPSD